VTTDFRRACLDVLPHGHDGAVDIRCGSCGSEDLVRDPDASVSSEIPLLCRECGWTGSRTPILSCPRCGKTDIDQSSIQGSWAYADLEEARENPSTAAWGYVEKAVNRCLGCRNEWTTPGAFVLFDGLDRPPTAESASDVQARARMIEVWARISALAGETFTTKTGRPFAYDSDARAVHLRNTNRSLPRAQFEAALERFPVSGPGELQDLQGPSYIYAILTDRRVSGG